MAMREAGAGQELPHRLLQVAHFRAVHGNAPVGFVGVATCGGVTTITSAGRDGCLQRYEYVAAALWPAIERSKAAPVQGGLPVANGGAEAAPPVRIPSHDCDAEEQVGWLGSSSSDAPASPHPPAHQVVANRLCEHLDNDSPGDAATSQTCENAAPRAATRAALLQGGKQRGNRQSRPPQRLQPHHQPLVPTFLCPLKTLF